MTNMFASYGETAAPRIPDRRAERAARIKPKSKLDLKMEERQRLSKSYRALKRQERQAVVASEPRLKDFLRYLLKIGPDDGDELLEALQDSWLMTASRDVRAFALSRIARRADKIKLMLGMTPMSDPLDDTSVFFEAQKFLSKAGRL